MLSTNAGAKGRGLRGESRVERREPNPVVAPDRAGWVPDPGLCCGLVGELSIMTDRAGEPAPARPFGSSDNSSPAIGLAMVMVLAHTISLRTECDRPDGTLRRTARPPQGGISAAHTTSESRPSHRPAPAGDWSADTARHGAGVCL